MPDFLTLGASLDQKNAFLWSKVVFKNEETKLKSKYCHDDFDNWTNLEWRKLTLTITNNRVLVILVIESPKPTNSLGNFYFCLGRNETLVAPCIAIYLQECCNIAKMKHARSSNRLEILKYIY